MPSSASETRSSLLAALLVLGLAAPAAAAGRRVEAERVVRQADRAFADGDFAAAARGYEAYLKEAPSLGVTADAGTTFRAGLRRALASRGLGRYATAAAQLAELAAWCPQFHPSGSLEVAAEAAETLALQGFYARARVSLRSLLAGRLPDDGLEARVRRTLSICEGALGDYAAQEREARRAISLCASRGDRSGEALALAALAQAEMANNRFPEAVARCDRALSLVRPRDASRVSLELTRASALAGSGRYQEALASAHASLEAASVARTPETTAAATGALGECYFLIGDHERARDHLERALVVYEELGALDDIARRSYQVGRTALAMDNPARAERSFLRSLEIYRQTEQPIGQAVALAGLGAVRESAGDAAGALARHTEALALFRASSERNGIAGSLVAVGRAHARLGDVDRALASVAEAEAVARDPDLAWRASHVRGIALRRRGDAPGSRAAWLAAVNGLEALRSGLTLRELRGTFGAPEERARVYEDLLFSYLDAGEPVAAFELSERFRARVFREMRGERSAVATDPVAPRVRAALDDRTLLSYFVGRDELTVFVVRVDGLEAVRVPVSEGRLRDLVDEMRTLIVTLRPIEPVARALDELLLAPVRARLGNGALLIVPHDALHYLPFAALLGPGDRWLMQDRALSVLPAADLAVAGAPVATAGLTLALADPDLGDRALALPFARAEVEALRSGMGASARVLVGAAATRAAFLREAPRAWRIHLAVHGVLDVAHPLESFLELAPSRPGAADGRLTVREVQEMRLRAELVVLSACDSGRGRLVRGDELIGLSRAFLGAGCAGLVSTLWPVSDRSTAALVERFYAGLGPHRAPEALALAQRAQQADPRRAHPFHWAAFSYCGAR